MTELAKVMDKTVVNMSKKEGKYLAFTLDNEEYGIGILTIKEIIGMMPITSVPRTPDFVKGVINLRGKVIPVVDLRSRFDMEVIDYDERTCIVVIETAKGSSNVMIGIIVDSVSEVLKIKGEDIEEAPLFGVKLNTEYILGMAKRDGGVKILLNIDRVLSGTEIGANEELNGLEEKEKSIEEMVNTGYPIKQLINKNVKIKNEEKPEPAKKKNLLKVLKKPELLFSDDFKQMRKEESLVKLRQPTLKKLQSRAEVKFKEIEKSIEDLNSMVATKKQELIQYEEFIGQIRSAETRKSEKRNKKTQT